MRPGPEQNPVVIPKRDPLGDGTIPTVKELLEQRRETSPNSTPMPLEKPRVVPPSSDDPFIETRPFSPNDEVVVPPSTVPTVIDTDLPITLEELRRLDPSVQDVQIISIEDT